VAQAPAPVTASFQFAPAAPLTGEVVTFTSTSTVADPGNAIVSQTWDLDGDGAFGDATGPSATAAFAAPGTHVVSLRVQDADSMTSTFSAPVVAGDRPPVAGLTFAPAAPVEGETITFTSQSSDAEGPVVEAWDLDGDGVFAEAGGPVATTAFLAGSHVVRLRVVDSAGVERVVAQEVIVAAPLKPLGLPGGPLKPLPVVRLVGTASGTRTLVSLLAITAPPTASAVIRCRGGGCPFSRRSRTFRGAKRGTGPTGTRTVRIRTFAGEPLSPGVRIQVFVTDPLRTGKYTSFTIRTGKAPRRADRCSAVGKQVVIKCPKVVG